MRGRDSCGWTTMVVVAALGSAAAQEGEDIRGPKALIEVPVPEPATPWLTYGLILLAVLVAVGLMVWMLGRRKRTVVSPEEMARRELDRLRTAGAAMPAGVFAETVSGVLRNFIERRFGVAAPRRTTEEFLIEASGDARGLGVRVESLRDFLRICDRAKFGGDELDQLTREQLLLKARGFINESVGEGGAA